jgi:hypothetical protein
MAARVRILWRLLPAGAEHSALFETETDEIEFWFNVHT